MYKVTKRDCPMFGIGPYVCEFICDTASDISTLPTSISEGTGGRTAYDNQKCASGSMAIVADNGAESKQYMLNNQDIWCPYSVAAGSSDSVLEEAKAYTDSEIADLINGAPTTRDTLKEIADAMAENQTVVEALDAAIGSKADKTDIPTSLPANGGNADTVKSIREDIRYIDIFSTSLSYDHACWNKNCCVTGQSVDPDGDLYIINAPESSDALWYEVMTIGNISGSPRAYQIAHGCYGHQRKSFIRYKHDDVWSDWKNIADGGNANTVNGHTVNADVPADLDFSAYALKSKYGDTTIDVGRKSDTTIGSFSTAEGYMTSASGNSGSHAEGFITTASGDSSHAEGSNTTASGMESHAEGNSTTASGDSSHAEGIRTTASGHNSHAEGLNTTASNACSHAIGHRNANMTNGGAQYNTIGTAFVIGNGTSSNVLSNAFSVMFDGTVKAMSTITASTTADYAEFFEWLDENPDSEDRVGYFVTMDGDKIRIANADDDYILGVVSGEPFVLGNGDCDTWNGMFLRDEFRRTIYEPAPKIEEILDDDGNPTGEFEEIKGEFEGTRPKLNPEYDHTKTYTSRFDRPEWSPVGMLGVLAVRHDGTAKVNGYVTVADGGIATACDKNVENSYRVIKANTDSVVEIIFR